MAAALAYPPSPWQLCASGHCSLWRVPAKEFHLPLPDGVHPLTAARSVWLASGFVNYGPEGDLSYRELFLAVLVRTGRGCGLHVTSIWVDSEVSLRGGRALWGVPKELAHFHITASPVPCIESYTHEGMLACSSFEARWRWPFRSRVRAIVIQTHRGALQYTPVAASARVTLGSAHWQLSDASPLRILAGRKPVLSVGLAETQVRFGA